MTKVVLPGPIDGLSPALFGRFSNHLVVDFKRNLLGSERLESLGEGWAKVRERSQGVTHDSHRPEVGYDGIREDADL